MSYRRLGKAIRTKGSSWDEWCQLHSAKLSAIGLPESVLRDEEHWWDFLQHGYLDHHADPARFCIDELPLQQRSLLRQFLQETLSPDEARSATLLRQLE